MKRFISYITIHATVAIAAIVLLAGCDKNEQPAPENDHRTALGVQVIDRGYAPAPGEPADSRPTDTRATENGYKTVFTAGDKVGLYAVKNGVLVASCKNLCLTLTTENGTLVWKPSTELTYEGTGTTYYAYYPYQNDTYMNGKVNASAADATGFFATLVSDWTPLTDQSTSEKYTAQDLMVGSGTVDGSGSALTLSLTLTHQMALAVIKTPTTKYTFTNTNPTVPDYIIPITDLTFNDFKPLSMEASVHRYLVKPAVTTQYTGSYTNTTSNTQEFLFTPNITVGNYATYTVDNATVIAKSHTLQVGDFYLNDGTLIGKDETLSNAQKSACLGIVLKVGKDNLDDCKYKMKDGTTAMSTVHGYVLALYDANKDNTCKWSLNHELVGTRRTESGFNGYSDTQIIKTYAAANGKTFITDFPAAYWASEGYETSYSSPTISSGWFLPSGGQCMEWCNNEVLLLAQVKKVTENSSYNWQSNYWSSSEYTGNNQLTYRLEFDKKKMTIWNKTVLFNVRSCLVF